MPVSSSTEHWIKPDALTINLNHFGDPDYLQVSVLAGAVVMAFKQDVIGYNAAHNYRTWPLEAANTYLETSSAYNVYARLTRSEVNARALIVYDTVLRDIEGREISYAEDGTEILGDASADYFFVFLGQVSSNIDSNDQIIQREWIVDPNFGKLDTNQQKNDTVGLFDLMFKPHYDNPLDPNEITWIEALTHLGVAGGITMYANGGKLNIPSIYDGLPIDWYTLIRDENGVLRINPDIELGGGGVSNFWDLSGIPSWITNSKPKYSYSEIEGTPDLSGYATQSWVENKKYLTAITSAMVTSALGFTPYNSANFTSANIKSTLGISDWALASSKPSYTTSEVTEGSNLYFTNTRAINALAETLKDYVTLGGTETITGEKNFTGGLKVNGSPIYYDTEKKYWKLEGDLLVTGGVTMYGSDSSFTPSTIMDAIVVDNVTIIKQDGKLVALGGGSSGGGLADAVAWGNILGKPSWITDTTPSISISGTSVSLGGSITQSALRSALGLGSNAYTSTAYLPLSGGTITNTLQIGSNDNTSFLGLRIVRSGSALMLNPTSSNAYIGLGAFTNGTYSNKYMLLFGETGLKYSEDGQTTFKDILHSGNYSNYALPLSGGTLSGKLHFYDTNNYIQYTSNYFEIYNAKGQVGIGLYNDGTLKKIGGTSGIIWHSGNFTPSNYLPLSGGMLKGIGADFFQVNRTDGNPVISYYYNGSWLGRMGYNTNGSPVAQIGSDYQFLLHSGNIGSYNAGSATKLQTARTIWGQSFDGTGNVSGNLILGYNKIYLVDGNNNYYIGWNSNSQLVINNFYDIIFSTSTETVRITSGGKVGIGTTDPSQKFHVLGSARITGSSLLGSYVYVNTDGEGMYFSATSINMHNASNNYSASLIGFTFSSITLYQNTTVQGNILATGGITMYSMRALKNVVDERGLSLSELSTIKPTRYTWKDGRDNRLHFGGIADDIQQVLPEVVYKTSDGILTMDYGNAAFAVASSLIKPVIDHEKRIAMLEEENKQLRQEVERLKSV